MPDDALQLVAAQGFQRASRHRHHAIRRIPSRRKGVDPPLGVHDVDRRHAHAGGDRHLLDDVEQAPLERLARRRLDAARADHLGHRRPAAAELRHVERAHREDEERRAERGPDVERARHGRIALGER